MKGATVEMTLTEHKNHECCELVEDLVNVVKDKVVELLDNASIVYGNYVYITYEATSILYNEIESRKIDMNGMKIEKKTIIEYIIDLVVKEMRDISRCK